MSFPNNSNSPPTQQNYQNFKPKKNFVERLPFWKRYTRGLIFSGGLLTFCIVFSAPIYHFFRTPTPEDAADPRRTMWPGEIAKGKTYAQQHRERILERQRKRKEAEEAKKASVTNSA